MTDHDRESIRRAASHHPELELLVLFGSRARADATGRSDWDLGYLARLAFDRERLLTDLVMTLATERIDLVDLAHAGGLIRFRAARDGVVIHEAHPDAFARFWFAAVSFWCDMRPILQTGYDEILADLPR